MFFFPFSRPPDTLNRLQNAVSPLKWIRYTVLHLVSLYKNNACIVSWVQGIRVLDCALLMVMWNVYILNCYFNPIRKLAGDMDYLKPAEYVWVRWLQCALDVHYTTNFRKGNGFKYSQYGWKAAWKLQAL